MPGRSRSRIEAEVRSLEEDLGELLERQRDEARLSGLDDYRDDPVAFIEEVLDGEPWAMQARIAEAVRRHSRVTVRSCHAAGKDWLAARLSLWWVYSRGGLVVLTGPTADQVQEILMRGEVREAFRGAGLPGELHVKALRPEGGGKAGILAKTATGVSQLTGFHDAQVLFCITEAQDPEIGHAWDAAFACTTGREDRILTLGNPTHQSGRFFNAHQPGSEWKSFKVAASDIPNVREGRTVIPGLFTREGVERFASEYGEESGFYQSRVLAEFPEEAEDGLIKRRWLEMAAKRWAEHVRSDEEIEAEPVVGVDPARFGPDKTAVAVRKGHAVEVAKVWGKCDLMDTVRRVIKVLLEVGVERNVGDQGRGTVIVDTIGVGSGVLDRLEEQEFSTVGFKASRKARDDDRFASARAEAWWEFRERLERGEIALPRDERLWQELLALRWRASAAGQVKIESKSDLRSRIGRSPDRADAVVMATYSQAVRRVPDVGIIRWS